MSLVTAIITASALYVWMAVRYVIRNTVASNVNQITLINIPHVPNPVNIIHTQIIIYVNNVQSTVINAKIILHAILAKLIVSFYQMVHANGNAQILININTITKLPTLIHVSTAKYLIAINAHNMTPSNAYNVKTHIS